MPDHGDNYTRLKDDKGEEIGKLGPECGHHCGVISVGNAGQHVAHCPCKDCHNTMNVEKE